MNSCRDHSWEDKISKFSFVNPVVHLTLRQGPRGIQESIATAREDGNIYIGGIDFFVTCRVCEGLVEWPVRAASENCHRNMFVLPWSCPGLSPTSELCHVVLVHTPLNYHGGRRDFSFWYSQWLWNQPWYKGHD